MGFDFPNIDPVALSLGPLHIRWYALAYLVGFLAGWQYCLRLARKSKEVRPDEGDVDDFLTWAIIGVILGGRLGYVLFYQSNLYLHDPLAALRIWEGGMSFHGGALGVILALILFAWRRKIELFRLSDMVVQVVPIGLFFGRIANFINGELYGRAAEIPWGVRFPHGGDVLRHPSQLYEAALEGLALFILLFVLSRFEAVRARPGIISGVFLIGYAAARGFVELFRQPDAHLGFIWGHISMGQILSAPMILAGLLIIALAVRKGGEAYAAK